MAAPPEVRIPIDDIAADDSIQARAGGVNPEVVEEYAEVYAAEPDEEKREMIFPPVDVFKDGDVMLLADGFSRLEAAKKSRLSRIKGVVRTGTKRDAILHAVKANSTHGQRRTNADKRRAVEMVLSDPDWANWSDRGIAKHCAVSQPFVSKVRSELSDNCYQPAMNGS